MDKFAPPRIAVSGVFLFLLIFGFGAMASAAEIGGAFTGKNSQGLPVGWSYNRYSGFLPHPDVELTGGVLHFSSIRGRNGFGVNSKAFAVEPGGKVTLSAVVRGKGRMYFRLHVWDANGRWVGLTEPQKITLTDKERTVEAILPVVNIKPGTVASKAQIMFGAPTGGELFIRGLSASYANGRYIAGKGSLPRDWKVFLPVPKDFVPTPAELESIPATLAGKPAKALRMNGASFDFARDFDAQKAGNCAWLFAALDSKKAREFTIGAGADWWVTVYVNGKAVIDTAQSGNATGDYAVSNHIGTAVLHPGQNVVAVKFVTGKASSKLCLGGPDDLREKTAYKLVRYIFSDDFEIPRPRRSGSPELVTGMISHGLLTTTRQAVYRSNAVLMPPQAVVIPDALADIRFAVGHRLYALDSKLEYLFGNSSLTLTAANGRIRAELVSGGKSLLALPFSVSLLPVDIMLSIGRSGACTLTVKSLADSSKQEVSGRMPFPENASLRLAGPGSVRVDQLFAGLAVLEGRKKSFPFRLKPDETFNPVRAGWKRIFSEDFDGTQLDASKWKVKNPGYVKLDGQGHLVITADFDAKKILRSGGATSRKTFGFGWYEARLQFTREPGWWAAFWLFATGHHPMLDGLEVDIFEDYYIRKSKNGEDFILDHNLHTSVSIAQKSWNYLSTIRHDEFKNFHTIACKRTPFELSLYLDGRLIKSSAGHSTYNGVVFDPFQHGGGIAPLSAIFSGQIMKAKGGWGAGWSDPEKGGFPESFVVDHFRFYAYPAERAPEVKWKHAHGSGVRLVRPGEKFVFEAEARPSAVTGAPLKGVYLMDTGAIIAYAEKPPFKFDIALDSLTYENTSFMNPGRSGVRPELSGLHGYSAIALDADGMASCATPPVMILNVPDLPTRPYSGKPQRIPGTLNPSLYDEGGNGAAYHDDKGNSIHRSFRPGEDVDAGPNTIGRIRSGEWLKYTVDVAETGVYKAVLKCGTPENRCPHRLLLYHDGEMRLLGTFVVRPHEQADWKCDTFVELPSIRLKAGRQRLLLAPFGAFNFSTIEFVRTDAR